MDQRIQQTKELMQQYRFLSNPNALQELAKQNPNVKNILTLSQKHGVSLQQIAQIMAQQKGYNLNDIINKLQS